jgi:superfamily II DNA/RNA helicase
MKVEYGVARALKGGVDIVVGTPGRLIDHLEQGTLNLKDVDFVILDEADAMLQIGFADDVEKILNEIPP